MHWLTVEVFDGAVPAAAWMRAWHDRLVEAGVTGGAAFWDSREHHWGVVLEFAFPHEPLRDAFRTVPAVLAALDATPDPVNGVLVYPHRGGGAGVRQPRRPRRPFGTGAVEIPEPPPEPVAHGGAEVPRVDPPPVPG